MGEPQESIFISVFVEESRTASKLVPDVENAGLFNAKPIDEIGSILGRVATHESIAEIAGVPGVTGTEVFPERELHLIE